MTARTSGPQGAAHAIDQDKVIGCEGTTNKLVRDATDRIQAATSLAAYGSLGLVDKDAALAGVIGLLERASLHLRAA